MLYNLGRIAAPFLGLLAGLFVGLRVQQKRSEYDPELLAITSVVGFLGGCVILLLDAPVPEDQRPPTLFGKILMWVALLTMVLPGVGLLFGLPAFLVNRKVFGRENFNSRLALGVCIVLTVVSVGVWYMPLE